MFRTSTVRTKCSVSIKYRVTMVHCCVSVYFSVRILSVLLLPIELVKHVLLHCLLWMKQRKVLTLSFQTCRENEKTECHKQIRQDKWRRDCFFFDKNIRIQKKPKFDRQERVRIMNAEFYKELEKISKKSLFEKLFLLKNYSTLSLVDVASIDVIRRRYLDDAILRWSTAFAFEHGIDAGA